MSSLEFEGKNVDKAIQKACDELNLASDEISYEILSRGSSGIFGLAGKKNARIKVSLPQKTPEIIPDADSEQPDAPFSKRKFTAKRLFQMTPISTVRNATVLRKTPWTFPARYCSASSMRSLLMGRYRQKKQQIGFC